MSSPFTPEQEARIRDMILEEDFHSANGRYPKWAKNVPGPLGVAGWRDPQHARHSDNARRQGDGS